jgi:hypothetical protein
MLICKQFVTCAYRNAQPSESFETPSESFETPAGEALMVTLEVDNDDDNDNDLTQHEVDGPEDHGNPLNQAAAERAPNSDNEDEDGDEDEDDAKAELGQGGSQPLINPEEKADIAQTISKMSMHDDGVYNNIVYTNYKS